MESPPPTTQVSLEPPPWLELTTRPPSRSATRVRPPGQDPDVLTVVDGEGPQVDVAAHHGVVDPGGRGRQRDDPLGDPVAGIGLHLERQLVELGARGGRADDQTLATRAVDPLEDQVPAAGERVLADGVVDQVHRLDVLQDRILAQVVADHGRHVGVDELVVGHPVAHAVGDRHPSGPAALTTPGQPTSDSGRNWSGSR